MQNIPAKIVVIGAGSASFGLNTLGALLSSPVLKGSHMALVDRNQTSVNLVGRLAERLNSEWQAGMHITTHTSHRDSLEGADFVILSIEVSPREELWRSDFEIPLKYGVRQPYAENGGPGGFIHAARNIGPVMEIAADMEELCPDALLINYTNPMMRICDAVNRWSSIRVVGLCHQIGAGFAMAAKALAPDLGLDIPEAFTDCHASAMTNESRREAAHLGLQHLNITAAGTNHFTWMLSIHSRETGENLYPLFRQRWQELPPEFEPLTRRVFDAFGLFPIPGDEHMAEYLPWLNDPLTKPWEKYDISLYDWDYWAGRRKEGFERIEAMASGREGIDELLDADSEGAREVIEGILTANHRYHPAVNLPNQGQIPNLPLGAVVETPAIFTGSGIQPVAVEALPDGIAELCRREIASAQLGVDAAVLGDRQAALQCLLLDPAIHDLDAAGAILDDYLTAYRPHLPQFWPEE